MDYEQIKEITIAMIEKGLLYTGADNEEIAKNIAKFIKTLESEINN